MRRALRTPGAHCSLDRYRDDRMGGAAFQTSLRTRAGASPLDRSLEPTNADFTALPRENSTRLYGLVANDRLGPHCRWNSHQLGRAIRSARDNWRATNADATTRLGAPVHGDLDR